MATDLQALTALQRAVLARADRPPTPELTAALAGLAAAAPADLAARLADYRAALAGAVGGTGRLLEHFDGVATDPLRFLGPLADAAAAFVVPARTAGLDLHARVGVGPASVTVGAPIATVRAALPQRPVPVAHLPANSLAVALRLGPLDVDGAGFLDAARRQAGAILQADVGPAKAELTVLLDLADGAPAVLGVLRADFRPTGVQLGLGFSLDAVGGIVGINRTVDAERLRDRLVDGSAVDALFGGTGATTASLRATMAALGDVFPPSPGRHVVGPTLRLGWLNVAGWSLARLDVGVIAEIPSGRVYLPGRVVVEVPGPGVPLVHLRLDVLGEVDLPGARLALDAALVDSTVVGALRVSGTAAVRMAWGDSAVVLATVGGFYPGFDPRPAIVPPQRRIRIDMASPVPAGLTLRLEGYLAAAAGTLQAGAAVTLAFEVLGTGIRGSASFDAIVQVSPLWFQARVAGSVALRALGRTLAKVDLAGTLTGPGPLVLHARATAEIFGIDVGGSKSFVLSGGSGADRAPSDGLDEAVRRQLRDPANLTGTGRADPDVVLAPRPARPGVGVLAPGDAVVWSQQAFPLGDPLTKADGRILRRTSAVDVRPHPPGTPAAPVRRRLATSAFVDLTAADQLTTPAFDDRRAGLRLEPTPTRAPTVRSVSTAYRTVHLPVSGVPPWFLDVVVAHSAELAAAVLAVDGPPTLSDGVSPAVGVGPETWAVLRGGTVTGEHLGGASAQAHATVAGAAALPSAATRPVNLP